jgi:hypothetical protein
LLVTMTSAIGAPQLLKTVEMLTRASRESFLAAETADDVAGSNAGTPSLGT